MSGARGRDRRKLRAAGSAVVRGPQRSCGESGDRVGTGARAGWRRAARGAAASGGNGLGSRGKLSQRHPSRDNPAAEGCHVTIPPPGDTTWVLAKAQGSAELAIHQERLSGGLRAPATGGATQQARLSDSLRAPAAGGALQHGLQGPGGPPRGEQRGTPWAPRIKIKLSTPSDYLTVTHRLPVQQGQDYPEDGYVCAKVCAYVCA